MKYYKNASGKVFAYEDDGSQDHIIPNTYTAITETEALAITNPPLTVAEKKSIVQSKLIQRFHEELPYGQVLSMLILLLKQGALTGQEIAEQATQRVTLDKVKALQAHAKQLEINLDNDVNADIESGW